MLIWQWLLRNWTAIQEPISLTSAGMSHCIIVTDPTIWQSGFDLPRHTWSLMNRFRTGQGPCCANLHKWGLARSPCCDCGQRQTMNHCWHVPINTIWTWTESVARSWWCSDMAGIYSNCSTHKIIITIQKNYIYSSYQTTQPPVLRSTCISQHLQLRTGEFRSCKVLLPICPCWRQPEHSH